MSLLDTLDHFTTTLTTTITNIIMETAQEVASHSGGTILSQQTASSTRVPASLVHVKSPSAKPQAYVCTACNTLLAHSNDLVSKKFNGSHGKAYLFTKVNGINEGPVKGSCLTSGYHEISDISCEKCGITIGWKYIQATEPSQRYKEGKFILERNLITAQDEILPVEKAVLSTQATPSLQFLHDQFEMTAGLCIIEADNLTSPKSFNIVLNTSKSDKGESLLTVPTTQRAKGQSVADAARALAESPSLFSEEPFAVTIRPKSDDKSGKAVEIVHWFVVVGEKSTIGQIVRNGQRKLFTSADALSHLKEKDRMIVSDAIQFVQTNPVQAGSKDSVKTNASAQPNTLSSSVLLEGEAEWNVVNEDDDDFEDVSKPAA